MGSRASPDLYEVLGVDKSASESVITKAYRNLARKVHPDRPGGDTEKFKELNHAHEILSDPEKRAVYDQYGEEGLQKGVPQKQDDFISSLFREPGVRSQRRRTKDVVHTLPMSLELLYAGKTKKMAVRREVVDPSSNTTTCASCKGRGSKTQVEQLGGMIQQMSVPCTPCQGTGQIFKHVKEKEVLEVHIPRGAPDGHKIVFREKADEIPGQDTGDVVFVLKEQEHPEFKRRGADLFIERTISLSEALCGFELEVTHLDGRRLLVKSQPGEVIKPMAPGFDPLRASDQPQAWQTFKDVNCPSMQTVAKAPSADADKLKQVWETQLKPQGLDVCCFVIDHASGCAEFKSGTRQDVLDAQQPKANFTMHVVADPDEEHKLRMMKAVKNEGMPTLKNPFVYGNLFIILNIEFPQSLSPEAKEGLRSLLPAPLNTSELDCAEDAEVHTLGDMDPVQSFNLNKANMTAGSEAYDEDVEDRRRPGQPQCAQM